MGNAPLEAGDYVCKQQGECAMKDIGQVVFVQSDGGYKVAWLNSLSPQTMKRNELYKQTKESMTEEENWKYMPFGNKAEAYQDGVNRMVKAKLNKILDQHGRQDGVPVQFVPLNGEESLTFIDGFSEKASNSGFNFKSVKQSPALQLTARVTEVQYVDFARIQRYYSSERVPFVKMNVKIHDGQQNIEGQLYFGNAIQANGKVGEFQYKDFTLINDCQIRMPSVDDFPAKLGIEMGALQRFRSTFQLMAPTLGKRFRSTMSNRDGHTAIVTRTE